MPDYEIEIEPMEPLLFGDNRSARAGVDHLQLDQDPSPLTVFGAIGQLLIEQSDSWPGELLGEQQDDILEPENPTAELLGFCYRNDAGEPFFSRPRHLRCEKVGGRTEIFDLLSPREPSEKRISWRGQWPRILEPAEADLLDIDEDEGEHFLSLDTLSELLCHRVPESGPALYRPEDLYKAEGRPGISVDNQSSTVFEGQFFTRPYRRFVPSDLDPRQSQAGFTAWYRTLGPLPRKIDGAIGFLGGDRRRARFRFSPCGVEAGSAAGESSAGALSTLRKDVIEAVKKEESAGFLLYLLTPLPQVGEAIEAAGQQAVAAALGKAGFASGWNVKQRRPRPMLPLCPAGSVFFFDWPTNVRSSGDKESLIGNLWLAALGRHGAAAGFGRCLVGVWR